MLSHREEGASSTSKIMSCLSAIGSAIMRPQKWIILNSVWQALNASVNNAYWIAQAWDIFMTNDGADKEDYFIGLSFYAFISGVSLSPIITIGSVYSHYILNTVSTHLDTHQSDKADEEEMRTDPRSNLKIWQRVLHAFDYISHTSDNAGLPLLVFSLALPDADNTDKIYCQCIATFCGALAAVADSITCYNNIRLSNQIKNQAHEHAEFAREHPEPPLEEKIAPQSLLIDTVRQSLVENAGKPNILLQIKIARKELSLFAKNYRNTRPEISIHVDPAAANDSFQPVSPSS